MSVAGIIVLGGEGVVGLGSQMPKGFCSSCSVRWSEATTCVGSPCALDQRLNCVCGCGCVCAELEALIMAQG